MTRCAAIELLAHSQPTRLLLQAMALGTWEDATLVSELYGDDVLRGVLAVASAGIVGPAAWQYWHRRLGYMNPPPMPTRVLA